MREKETCMFTGTGTDWYRQRVPCAFLTDVARFHNSSAVCMPCGERDLAGYRFKNTEDSPTKASSAFHRSAPW